MTMKKVSLNKKHPHYEQFKVGMGFNALDGTLTKKGVKYHFVTPDKPVFSEYVPNGVLQSNEFIVEDVKNVANKK